MHQTRFGAQACPDTSLEQLTVLPRPLDLRGRRPEKGSDDWKVGKLGEKEGMESGTVPYAVAQSNF